jgi:hypothetical protein
MDVWPVLWSPFSLSSLSSFTMKSIALALSLLAMDSAFGTIMKRDKGLEFSSTLDRKSVACIDTNEGNVQSLNANINDSAVYFAIDNGDVKYGLGSDLKPILNPDTKLCLFQLDIKNVLYYQQEVAFIKEGNQWRLPRDLGLLAREKQANTINNNALLDQYAALEKMIRLQNTMNENYLENSNTKLLGQIQTQDKINLKHWEKFNAYNSQTTNKEIQSDNSDEFQSDKTTNMESDEMKVSEVNMETNFIDKMKVSEVKIAKESGRGVDDEDKARIPVNTALVITEQKVKESESLAQWKRVKWSGNSNSEILPTLPVPSWGSHSGGNINLDNILNRSPRDESSTATSGTNDNFNEYELSLTKAILKLKQSNIS